MPRPRFHPIRNAVLAVSVTTLSIFIGVFIAPQPARAAFHLNEISRIMTGHNGDASIQAVELRMITAGENLVSGGMIKTYDAAGNPVATLGTFATNVANGTADRRILCATSQFQATFGITADLTIAPGILVGTGQVTFETATCLVDGIAYGAVNVPRNGTTSAAAVPKDLAYVLVRTVSNPTFPTCPLAEDAAARMALQSGNAASPVVFQNNAGAAVNVFSTLTSVDGLPLERRLTVMPNPVRLAARISAPGYRRLTIHDVRGRLIRVLATGMERTVSPYEGVWDGRDALGRRVASGVYVLRYAGREGPVTRRFVVAR